MISVKNEEEYFEKLRQAVRTNLGHELLTSRDFEWLQDRIKERLGESIGISTLKRFWGYVSGDNAARGTTLDILSRMAGFPDWQTFVADYCRDESAQTSRRIFASSVECSDIVVGDSVTIEWQPQRHVRLLCIGEGEFEVVLTINSKLRVGDTFHCNRFILGQPLYVDKYVHDDDPPCFFVVGKQGGLTSVKVNED